MRLYHIALLAHNEPNAAISREFRKAFDEYKEIDWLRFYQHGQVKQLRAKIISDCAEFKPDVIFCQLQTPDVIDAETADILRHQGAILISFTGDVRENIDWYIALADHITFTIFTNRTDVKKMHAVGKAAEYCQVGFDSEIYCPGVAPAITDVVFLGNNYLQSMNFPLSQERWDMVQFLKQNLSSSQFSLWGNGWGIPHIHLNPLQEANCLRGSKIAINHSHFDYENYSSDRNLRAMACGSMVLSKYYKGIEEEFTIGVHLDTWRTFGELLNMINYYLSDDGEALRQKIALAGQKLVLDKYTWRGRTQELIKLIERYK
jgi:spore maturation protein CgeB